MPREQLRKLVAELARNANAIHKAHGRHGLQVEDGGIEIGRPAPAGARSGGRS